jgi:broad specificity phosphatase PhoE
MTTIHLCRHGRTAANASGLLLGRADPELDPTGRAQARAIAAAIGPPGRVVASPLARCQQTAQAFGVPIETDPRWAELDYGDFDLTPLGDIPAATWSQWRADPDFRPPNGETLRELAARVGAALDELAETATTGGDGAIVVVTHVSPIKAALAWALGVGIEVSWRCFVAQAAITTIGVGPTGPSLRAFNLVSHLDGVDGVDTPAPVDR